MTTTDKGPVLCDLCNKEIMPTHRAEDLFCHGCSSYICEDCDVNYDPPWGAHDKKVHLEENWPE